MTSYLANPVATRKTIVDGWLQTGDIGYQNDGNWFLVDRAKVGSEVRASPAWIALTAAFCRTSSKSGVGRCHQQNWRPTF